MTAHGHDHSHAHVPAEDNSFAGNGAVLLDIGDGFGACIISAPEAMVGVEIEYQPVDREPTLPLQHVAVVPRRTPAGDVLPTAVFPSLPEGRYAFWERPNGPARLTVTVRSGEVSQQDWPAS